MEKYFSVKYNIQSFVFRFTTHFVAESEEPPNLSYDSGPPDCEREEEESDELEHSPGEYGELGLAGGREEQEADRPRKVRNVTMDVDVYACCSDPPLPHNLHNVPAAPAGTCLREDAVPGRLHQGGARTAAGPHRGQGTGQSVAKARCDAATTQ